MKPWMPLLALAAACTGAPDPAPLPLPADALSDLPRTGPPASPFDVSRPTDLDLRARLVAPDGRALSPRDRLVVATLTDADGQIAWRGAFGPDGRLRARASLPAEPLFLHVEGPGFASRHAALPDLAAIDRTMVLVADPSGPFADDLDGDGVPATWDAAPADPAVAFVNTTATGVAFEDMVTATRGGDADFNDFVADLRTVETANLDGVTGLAVEAVGRAKVSGYDHAFGATVSFDGRAEVLVARFRAVGDEAPYRIDRLDVADGPGLETVALDLFPSTRSAVGARVVATIRFPEGVDASTLSAPDPTLRVPATRRDVRLAEGYVDEAGYPRALSVPAGWNPPGESVRIGRTYPEFDAWRALLLEPEVTDAAP